VETQIFFAWPTQYLDNFNSLHFTVDSSMFVDAYFHDLTENDIFFDI
jgi:hypothetical protein